MNEPEQLLKASQDELEAMTVKFQSIKMVRDMLALALEEEDQALTHLLMFRLKILLIRQSVQIREKIKIGFTNEND